MSGALACRCCDAPLTQVIADLGESPLANALVEPSQAAEREPFFPLRLFVCTRCWLVQLPAVATPERLFGDYAYFSSYSTTWRDHGRRYAAHAVDKLGLKQESLVVELASNDGCLLKEFAARSIDVLGIEPAANVAAAASASGIPTLTAFFGSTFAEEFVARGRRADLVVANNVLAHVPQLNDFVAGIETLLGPHATATLEFPHLLRMIERGEFDTIYHEHYSYFSLMTVDALFRAHGLDIVGVDELPTHGGSLRIEVRRHDAAQKMTGPRLTPAGSVDRIKEAERAAGLDSLAGYASLEENAKRAKHDLREFLIAAKREGRRVAGYGAPAKATTLLNYCGVRSDLLEFTVDKNPRKQGRFVPGVRIPIEAPEKIFERRPDYVLIFPWNIGDEVREQMSGIRAWGGRFVVAIPQLEVIP